MTAPVRVLVVDDSATMRSIIGAMLTREPDVVVVGEAADAIEARQAIKALNPDVITLDIEMPGMDGLAFLEKIMTLRPMPVVIVSSLTKRAAAVTLRALELGAFDCFAKPDSIAAAQQDVRLSRIVRAAARCPVRTVAPRTANPRPRSGGGTPGGDARLIAIGSSTGGVDALLEVIGGFPEDCPPTVIVQHMPAMFTGSFAERLDRQCPPHVEEARSGTVLQRGHVYLAPGGLRHMEIVGAAAPRIRLWDGDTVSGHRPSVDVLFRSVAKLGVPAIGIILTGMGADGALGLKDMRDAGARTIGQDQASCVVYGMPQAAFNAGGVARQLPLSRIAAAAMDVAA